MRIAVILGSLLVALVGAGSAHAACYGASSGEIKAPKTAAAGATLKFKAYNDAAGATLTVEAADPARPISHPYTRSDVPKNWFDVTVETERGDGRVRVRLDSSDGPSELGPARAAELRTVTVPLADGTFTTVTVDVPPGTPIDQVSIPNGSTPPTDPGGEQCRYQVIKEIRLVRGRKTTRPRVTKRTGEISFDLIGGTDCNDLAAPLPGIVSVRGPGGSFTERFAHICSNRGATKRRSGHPRFSLSKTDTGKTTLDLPFAARTSFAHRYTYVLKVGGRVRERGVIVAKQRFTKGHKVWDGTDEFWNFCINGAHTVWSENGKLYCWSPAWQDRHTSLTRHPR